MRKYRLVAKKGEGTFSEVLKAQNVKDGKYYAIKCMKNRFDSIDQVNNLREIQALRRLSPNEHVITLEEVLYDQPTGRLALVFELMDANLYELIRGRRHYLNGQLVRSYMYQLLKALDHMHRKGIFHRDIKPENILIESTNDLGRGLKLADFGSCRGIYSKQPYTEYISTRWYRAPECLLTDGYYGPEMDQWGAGCVFFEITSLYPLFPGTNELDQIGRVHKVLGNPSGEVLGKFKRNGADHVDFNFATQKGIGVAQLIPHASPECVDLITKLLRYDWSDRCTARESLRHPYFREIREADMRKAQLDKSSSVTRGGGGGGAEDGADEAGTIASTSRVLQLAHRASLDAGHSQVAKALPTIGQGGSATVGVPGGGGGAPNGAGNGNVISILNGGNMGGGARGGKKHPKIAKTGSLARGLGGSKYNLLAAGGGGGGGGGGVGSYGAHGNGDTGGGGIGNDSTVASNGDVGAGGGVAGGGGGGGYPTGDSSEESALPPIMGILGSGTKTASGGASGAGAEGGGGGGAGGDGGGGKYGASSLGQGGSKSSSKKKKKNRGYYDGSMRAKYNGMNGSGSGGGGGGGGGGNGGSSSGYGGVNGTKGNVISSRSSVSLMQASGGGSGGSGVGYSAGNNAGGGVGGGAVSGSMPAQATERMRAGKNNTRYRQMR